MLLYWRDCHYYDEKYIEYAYYLGWPLDYFI